MLANKIVILLWISIFSVSWIQATPDGKEAKGLSLSEDYARWFRQKYFQAITDEDRSSNDSVSRSTTSTVSNTLSDEGSGQEDIFTDDGSGLPASTSEDDFSEVTSPLPVTTTEDFTFEGPASTSVVIKNDSKKIEEADQHSLCVIIIVVSVSAVILLLILLTVIKIYCRCCKVRQEEHAAKEPFIRFSKVITE